ncbi:50S ribosomal protein L22 [Candidatus Gracilibacteria bacterium]|nr:50S ribosomal protein L22 [Candidatus Gracilibacteria bacterium]
MKAKLSQVRISPKKANLIAQLVRNMHTAEAIQILTFTQKKSAPVLKKLIESAVANAKNNFKQKPEELYIKEIIVTEGPTLKRSLPVSKGRTHPILKRTSHITVTVESRNVVSAPTEAKEEEAKTEEDPKAEKEETVKK